ncbi:MAG: arylamine N-acetyltransferase [bacterium]|nr:arylamine N-acetyltransferase [bacterium]MDI1337327.1 arylamine N-acetyltransferase [Lacunisphaera sp.]
MSAPDLDAYFARIDYSGPRAPTLATLQAIAGHHVAAIPFENLDVLLNRPPRLDPAALMEQLVHAQRGGYCFQQNGLLLHVLGALGFAVRPLSARVRIQRPRDFVPPRTHLFLRVELADGPWIVDAGVGAASLTTAIRFVENPEQATPHDTRRIVREGGSYFHQIRLNGEWSDVCEFTGEEMPLIDRELANWWTSTNPESKFRQNLMAARSHRDGTRCAILNREFTRRRGAEVLEQRELTSPEELLAVLAEHFGLHFPAGTRFGPPGSPWPQ